MFQKYELPDLSYMCLDNSPGNDTSIHDAYSPFEIDIYSGSKSENKFIGTRIDKNGNVFSWSGTSFNDSLKKLLIRLSQSKLNKIMNMIIAADLKNYEMNSDAEIISVLSVSGGQSISWEGIQPPVIMPDRISDLVYAVRRISSENLSRKSPDFRMNR